MVPRMIRLPKPAVILFDWDNTLVDTWPMIHKAINMTMRHMEHPEWSFEKVKSNVTKSMRDSFPELFKERWEEAAQHYQDSYRATHLETLRPLAEAETMIQVAAKTATLGLVSNKRGDSLRKEMMHLGWDKYFATAVGSGDAARDKPACDPVWMALDAMGVERGAPLWFIGDTVVDIECAKNIDATAILYGDHATEGNIFEGFPFAAQVRDHTELAALIAAAR
jgi:phosphoglycolate phosphatase